MRKRRKEKFNLQSRHVGVYYVINVMEKAGWGWRNAWGWDEADTFKALKSAHICSSLVSDCAWQNFLSISLLSHDIIEADGHMLLSFPREFCRATCCTRADDSVTLWVVVENSIYLVVRDSIYFRDKIFFQSTNNVSKLKWSENELLCNRRIYIFFIFQIARRSLKRSILFALLSNWILKYSIHCQFALLTFSVSLKHFLVPWILNKLQSSSSSRQSHR